MFRKITFEIKDSHNNKSNGVSQPSSLLVQLDPGYYHDFESVYLTYLAIERKRCYSMSVVFCGNRIIYGRLV
jgi:hypothetical protein